MHFTVMVITAPDQTVEELLAPFNEDIEVEPYVELTRDEIIAKVHADDKRYLEDIEKAIEEGTDCWFHFAGDDWSKGGKRFPTQEDLEHGRDLVANRTDEEAHAAYLADNCNDATFDEEGNELSTYNPKSKWDWYVEGGRWDGIITTKSGASTNCCRIGDIMTDVDPNSEEYRHCVRFWEIVVDGDELKEGEDPDDFRTYYRTEYFRDNYDGAEDYAQRSCSFGTYAVLTSDGEWHEQGEGLFRESDEEKKDWDRNFLKYFVEDQPDDYFATIVDCHI